MTDVSQFAATKKDIRLLLQEIGRLYVASERWKDELLAANENGKENLKRHFDAVAETIHLDAHRGRIENYENRIIRLEQHAGLVSG